MRFSNIFKSRKQSQQDLLVAEMRAEVAEQALLLAQTKSVEVTTPVREAAGVTIDKDEDDWRPLSGDAKRDLSPVTQKRMRDMAFFLWETNLLANRLIELPLAYILGEGVKLQCDDPENQKSLNRFWNDPINQMSIKLPKKARELAINGEQCWPTFVNEHNGHVRLGYLDPALIEKVMVDPDNPEQPIGIITCKDSKYIAKKYKVIVNGPETIFTQRTQQIRSTFTDGEAFYFTINDLSNGKRGRSDLLAQADWLDAYDEFLFGELDRSAFERAFVWDVKLTGATPDEIKARAKDFYAPKSGSVRVHNDQEEWDAVAPTLNGQDSQAKASLFRNHVLGGGTIPEHWFGGGGDVNRAVGAEMGEPTFKMFSMRQQTLKHILECIGIYVLRQKHLAVNHQEPDLEKDENSIVAVFPEMTAKDTSKYAAALQQVVVGAGIAIEKGLITDETGVKLINSIAGRLGVEIDADEELKKTKEKKDKSDDDDTFTTPEFDTVEK